MLPHVSDYREILEAFQVDVIADSAENMIGDSGGVTADSYYTLLYALARNLTLPGWCLETGTDAGGSSLRMARASLKAASGFGVVTIDIAGHSTGATLPQNYDGAINNLSANSKWLMEGVSNRVVQIGGNSLVVGGILSLPIKLLFVDGGHDYPTAYSDCETFWPMLLQGGIMVVDDFKEDDLGLSRGVLDFLDSIEDAWNPVIFNDRCLVTRRM